MSCVCDVPSESPNPRHKGSCAKCGKLIDPNWCSTDETVGAFFDRLEATFPGGPPSDFGALRRQCEARERAGRKEFGFAFLARRNLVEGREELSDFINYLSFDILKARRAGEDEEWGSALTAAYHAYMAYRYTRQREAQRQAH